MSARSLLGLCLLLTAPAFAADKWIDYPIGPFRIISNAGDKAGRENSIRWSSFARCWGRNWAKPALGRTGLETVCPIDIVLFPNQRDYLAHAPGKPFIDGGSATLSAWSADTPFPREWLKALARLLIDDNASPDAGLVGSSLCDLFSTIQVNNTHVNWVRRCPQRSFLRIGCGRGRKCRCSPRCPNIAASCASI